jgi:hypothetical protein
MDPTLPAIIGVAVTTSLTAAGVAAKAVSWAVKRELNGSAKRIKDIDERTARLETYQHRLGTRLARLEVVVEERTK